MDHGDDGPGDQAPVPDADREDGLDVEDVLDVVAGPDSEIDVVLEGLSAVDRQITTDDRVIPCLPNSMKLADWARTQGVDDKTAYRLFRAVLLPIPATPISTGISMKGAGSSTRIHSRFPRNHKEAPLETLSEIAILAARVTLDVTRGCHAARNLKDVAASDTETKSRQDKSVKGGSGMRR
jgi:hypothetical protein